MRAVVFRGKRRKFLDELSDAYWTYVAPAARRDGFNSENERPSYKWVIEHDEMQEEL